MNRTEYLDQMRWESIENTSGETCPAFGLLAITGSESRGRRTVLTGAKPSTTFYRDYAVNGPTAITAGKTGRCTRTSGGIWIKYDTGTPANAEGWGPKPGQWTASKGFPGITCEGIKDAGRYILLGTLGEIREVFGKPQSDIAAASGATTPNTGTVIVQYFDGTSYQATTFEMTGTNILPYKIKAGRLYKWVAVGDQWCAVELASRVWEGSIGSTCAAGASTTVTLSDGTSHSGKNVSGQLLQAGAVLAGDDAYSGSMLICGSAEPAEGGDGERLVWHCTLNEEIAPDATGDITLSDPSIGTSGVVTAKNWSNHPGVQGSLGIAWKEIDDSYQFFPDSARWWLAQLNGDLFSTDLTATIDNLVNIAGGSTPTFTDVDNQFGYFGKDNDTVLIVESPNAGSAKYILVQVWHRQARWFKALLNGALEPEDATATVDNVVALDGGPTPTITSVKNPHARRGLDNSNCLFVEDWTDLDESDEPNHILADMREAGPYLCKTDGAINKGASGTCSIWTGTPGSETDSTANVTAYNRFANVGSGKWVWVDWNGHGFYIIAAECPLT